MKMPPMRPQQMDYFRFGGGLDLESPALSLKPGAAIDAMNYEPSVSGGYRRIDGYERFDGSPRPSDANYWLISCTITGTISAGNTVTGVTSGATGVVLQVNLAELVMTKVSGTFQSGEVLNVSGSPQATTTSVADQNSASSVETHAIYKNLAADNYRSDIAAVPGSGNILGVVQYAGTVYAFRANAGGTAVDIYKSSSSGWVNVPLYYELAFTGGSSEYTAGETVSQGGVSATVKRIALESGAWTGTAAGRLIISAPTGGNFAAGAIAGGGAATASGAQTTITLSVGGRFEFVIYNFTGSTDTSRVYGCDGVNRAFEFDGATLVPIKTGMTADSPKFIAAHKNMLFLTFKGSLQNSGIGTPFSWSPVLGASEISTGEDIVGLLPVSGSTTTGALAVITRNTSYILYGSSVSDFILNAVTPDAGAVAYTVQNIGQALMFDDRGIRTISPTQEYGNFTGSTITQQIQRLINNKQGIAVASSISRKKNQYRVYFSDGTAIVMGFENKKSLGVMLLDYGFAIKCIWSGENTTGAEETYFGSSTGMVYQENKGTSFDGDAIEAWIRSAYNYQRSPQTRKSYKRLVLEMEAEGSANFEVGYDIGFASPDTEASNRSSISEFGGGGYWDQFTWDDFTWDAQAIATPSIDLNGTASNISVIVYSNNDYDDPWTLQGATIFFIPRRLSRGV